ncbi:oligosaccharide flippase family protein [Nocardioides panacis]|uniref:Oligosaccharide flippase family protein n=1 Tax=Nocardioides panacis TaxID=2849501 RepID=A0A975SYL7_9ACTN|nr:oligosaccharide flippase family protein [Nocardioides panacis]QWZ08383.1 oligosaccharide flippase family protein [Nocardioides panacis]
MSVADPSARQPGGGALGAVARGGSFAALGSGLGSVLGFVLTLVVTRGLSTTSAGQFFSATAVFIVLQTFLSFGVGAGLVRFVPRFRALDRHDDVPVLLVAAFVPVATLGVIGSVGLWFAAPTLAARIGHNDPAAALGSFRVLALLFLPGVLEVAAVECTRAFGSIRKYVLIQQVGVPALRPMLVGLGVAVGAPLWVLVLAWMVPLVLALTVATCIVGASLKTEYGRRFAWPARTRTWGEIAAEYWRFTAARGLSSVMEILINWLDVLLVATMVSATQTAIYAAASRFVTSGTLVLQALRLAIAGDVSAALARRDNERVSEIYHVASQWVVLTSWPLYLTMAIFGPTVLRIFGPSYSAGATALSVLCGAMLLNLAAGNVGTVLLMGGKSTWVLADKAASLAVNIAANLLLVPRFGITGAAVAWALTIVLDSTAAFCQVRWGMGIGGRLRGIVAAGMIALGCFGLLPLLGRVVFGSSLSTMLTCVGLGLVFYLPLIWIGRDLLGVRVLIEGVTKKAARVADGSS